MIIIASVYCGHIMGIVLNALHSLSHIITTEPHEIDAINPIFLPKKLRCRDQVSTSCKSRPWGQDLSSSRPVSLHTLSQHAILPLGIKWVSTFYVLISHNESLPT